MGERREAAETHPPSPFSGPRWSDQVALKSPPTIAMGVVVAVRLLQWRSVLRVIKSARYWAGLSVRWFLCSHCCSLSQSLLLAADGSTPWAGGHGK